MSGRLGRFSKEVSLLRAEIVKGIPEGGEPIHLTLSAEHAAVLCYSLAVAWLSEAISRLEGYKTVADTIGRVSSELLAADLAVDVDEAINKILGSTNPEEDGDGA